jgi:ribonuclease I
MSACVSTDSLQHHPKYISIPTADTFDHEDELNRKHRESSIFFNHIVGKTVIATAICAIIIVVILHYHPIHIKHKDSNQNCYVGPACTNINSNYDRVTGFTNLTGWPASMGQEENVDRIEYGDQGPSCCNICRTSTSITPITTPENIYEETNEIEYSSVSVDISQNYLLMDQIWLPQFCNALEVGHDPTLSHLAGSKCTDSMLSSSPRLTIHGLWPNLVNTSSICCNNAVGTAYPPLIPSLVQQWKIWQALQSYWIDPTTDCLYGGLTCSTCYLLNHEWQKHGTCFSPFTSSSSSEVDLEISYFTAGLNIHQKLDGENEEVANYVGQVIPTVNITNLYPKKVNVMCDPQATYVNDKLHLRSNSKETIDIEADNNIGVFLELQTCWLSSPASTNQDALIIEGLVNNNYTMIDCPPPFANAFTSPCPEMIYISNF